MKHSLNKQTIQYHISSKFISCLLKQFIMFGLVGLSGMAVGLGIINLCMLLWRNFPLANIAAFIVAVTWNFILNRHFTFQKTNKSFFVLWLNFVAACLGGAAVNWAVSIGLYYSLPFFMQHYNCAAIAGVATASVFNFVVSRRYVFRNKKSQNVSITLSEPVKTKQQEVLGR